MEGLELSNMGYHVPAMKQSSSVQPIDSTHQFAFFDKRKINPKKNYTVFILKTKFTKLIKFSVPDFVPILSKSIKY